MSRTYDWIVHDIGTSSGKADRQVGAQRYPLTRLDRSDVSLGHQGTGALPGSDSPESTRTPPARLAYSVDEAAAVLGIARETIYELIRTGQLRSRKAGSRRIIGLHHLLEFLDDQPGTDRRAG
jgi:excisionase family DNA binding protein